MGSGKAARAVDTGELGPVPGGTGDGEDLDPEEIRYAPRPPRRFTWARRGAVLGFVALLAAVVAIAGYRWTQSQYYVADSGDSVVIYRGVEADLPGVRMHHVEEPSDLLLDDLPTYNARQVRDGISANSLADARGIVSRLERLVLCPQPATTPSPSATPGAQPAPSPSAQPTPTPGSTPSPTAPATTPAVCTEAP
jgi:protein phosphatase